MSDPSADEPRPILLVEDDDDHRAATSDFLREEGYLVVEAANGRLALDYLLAAHPPPRLILLDIDMPVMTGVEMLNVLQRYLRLSRIPVVLVSAELGGAPASAAGVVDRLAKPFLLEDLLMVVQKHAGSGEVGAGLVPSKRDALPE